ncbi:hypothetical protein Pla123a_20980 [Posidoniimonas polymericola]|uniref:Phytase-like domain-containing protein n=1 Tax=Posidoniimonas polymericola TaxID=2528002 RepID=A0A5C5YRW0_9BACT|nr:choice-of-anchor tandem repeat NxxGxxAF-containing protein [Posidoniimonas polymericola]TWT77437.1 hypothetical protein Pla123a_20980 [Posidoniimonas polymericola]
MSPHLPRPNYFATLFLCVAHLATSSTAASGLQTLDSVETIALSGQAVPGFEGRTFENFFSKAVLNNYGEAAFLARLECCGPRDGAFTNAGGDLKTLALVDTPAFAVGGNSFREFSHVQIDDQGRTFIRGVGNGTPPSFDLIATGPQSGELTAIAESGDLVDPSEPGVTYRSFDFSHLGIGGRLAGPAATWTNGSTSPPGEVLFVSDGGPAAPLLRAGDQPSFTAPGEVYATTDTSAFERPVVNAAGAIAVRVTTINPLEIFESVRHIIRIDSQQGVERIVTESFGSDPALGSLFALTFPVINDNGDIGFGAIVDGIGNSLWLSRPGDNPSLLVREGDEPPTIPGGRFLAILTSDSAESPLGIAGDGSLAFEAVVIGPEFGNNDSDSLWLATPDGPKPIAIEGRIAPGVNGVFASESSTIGDLIGNSSVNERNQLAFTAQYVQSTGRLRTGLFATDFGGDLHKVAAPGDLLEMEPGILREIEFVEFRGDIEHGALGSGLNDSGQILFSARFTDGTAGVFLSRIVAVPEPLAFSLASLACVCVFGPRTRRS